MASNPANKLWQTTLSELQSTLPKAVYNTHLAGSVATSLKGDRLLVRLRNPYSRDWIQYRLNGTVERMARSVAGRPITIDYSHRDTAAAPAQPPPTKDPPDEPTIRQHFPGFEPISSNFTQVPNQFFTDVIPAGPAVVTAIVATIIYQTIGTIINWRSLERREWYEASNRQLAADAGISPGSIPKAVKIARERGYIITEPGEAGTRYRLRDAGEPLDLPVGEEE